MELDYKLLVSSLLMFLQFLSYIRHYCSDAYLYLLFCDSCVFVCFSLGYYIESLGYFRRAVAMDRLFLKACENLDNVCSRLVERWHFRMLNDAVRNSAFYRAISLAVDSLEPATSGGELVVLDIGTGSGILRYVTNWCQLMTVMFISHLRPATVE